jgi:hypothetical protein
MNAFSWDIETAKLLPKDTDLQAEMPLGITCAAGIRTDSPLNVVHHWWAGKRDGTPEKPRYNAQMSTLECKEMLLGIADQHLDGYPAMTWSGTGFEFLELAWQTNWWQECKVLALLHYDLFFHLFCKVGYFVSLDRACRGMGLPGKQASGMTGAEAPELWPKDPERVLEYVAQDVLQPMELVHRVEERGYAVWATRRTPDGLVNKSANRHAKTFQSTDIDEWLPVYKVLETPLPDTSWMVNPISRESVLGWVLLLPKLAEDDLSGWALPKEVLEIGLENGF